jgi:hypothetical protein
VRPTEKKEMQKHTAWHLSGGSSMMEEVCSKSQILSKFYIDPRNASGAGVPCTKKGGETVHIN